MLGVSLIVFAMSLKEAQSSSLRELGIAVPILYSESKEGHKSRNSYKLRRPDTQSQGHIPFFGVRASQRVFEEAMLLVNPIYILSNQAQRGNYSLLSL